MKSKTLFLIALLLPNFLVRAEEDTKAQQYLEIVANDNPMFKSAIAIPEVKEIYTGCYEAEKAKPKINGEKLSNCLWGGIQSNKAVKDKVMKLVDKQSGTEGSGRYRTTMETKKHHSKGIEALKQFYQEKLEAALYGEYDGKKQRYQKLANQRTFFELYKTQLGKNIIASMTSYCIESTDTKFGSNDIPFIDDNAATRETIYKENIRKLSQVNPNSNKLVGYQQWEGCIQNINRVCYGGNKQGKFVKYESNNGTITQSNDVSKYSEMLHQCKEKLGNVPNSKLSDTEIEEKCENVIAYSNQRACNVMQYVELARQSILKTDAIVAKMDNKEGGIKGLDNIEMYDSKKNRKESIDALTTISSGEALEALSEGHAKDKSEMEECYKDGAIIDEEACSKYLSSDSEQQYALLGELRIQQEATLEKLKNIENDPEQVQRLLKEEGYTDDQAKALSEVAGVKEQIEKRYAAKKEAILQSLKKEIEEKTTSGDEFDANADKGKIAAIAKEIKDRPKNFASLVHYNNVVSSFLEIRGGTSKDGSDKVRNTAALAAEMKNSFISEENIEKYKELGVDPSDLGYNSESLNERFADIGMDYSEGTSSNDNAVLGINDINGIIIGLFTEGGGKESEGN